MVHAVYYIPVSCRSMSVRRSDVPDFQTTPVTTYNKFKKRTEKQFLDIGQVVSLMLISMVPNLFYFSFVHISHTVYKYFIDMSPISYHNFHWDLVETRDLSYLSFKLGSFRTFHLL